MGKVASFMDDVIIRMEEEEGHDELVKEIVRRLVENNLYVKPEILLSGEKHKRTQQGVSAKLESYLYCYGLVYAITSCQPHVLLKATMCTLYALTLSSRSFYYVLGL